MCRRTMSSMDAEPRCDSVWLSCNHSQMNQLSKYTREGGCESSAETKSLMAASTRMLFRRNYTNAGNSHSNKKWHTGHTLSMTCSRVRSGSTCITLSMLLSGTGALEEGRDTRWLSDTAEDSVRAVAKQQRENLHHRSRSCMGCKRG